MEQAPQGVERTAEEVMADKIFGPEEDDHTGEDFDYDPGSAQDDDDAEPEETEESDEPEEADEADEEADEESADGDFEDVEYNGKVYAVPKELKEALMRHDDYTRKTQEIAVVRKQAESQIGELKMVKEQYDFARSVWGDIQKVQSLDEKSNEWYNYMKTNVDTLSGTDIEKIRLQLDDFRREKEELIGSVRQREAQFQQAQQQSTKELLDKGTEILRQRVPGWNSEAQRVVRDYALQSGFTEAEVGQVIDPRYVEVLWKAHKYDALQANKGTAVRKVQAAPTIKQKARNPMPGDVKTKLAIRKQLNSPKLSDKEKAKLVQERVAQQLGL